MVRLSPRPKANQVFTLTPMSIMSNLNAQFKFNIIIEVDEIKRMDLLRKRSPEALASQKHLNEKKIFKNYTQGGLPGICFLRSAQQRLQAFQNHISTLIERDLPLIRQIQLSPNKLVEVLRHLVVVQGQDLNKSALARKVKLSSPTWIFSELKAQWIYRKDEVLAFDSYQTRGGSHVPFVVRLRNGKTLAIIYEDSDEIPEKAVKSIYSIQKKQKNVRGIILNHGKKAQVLKNSIWTIPYTWIV